MVFRFAVTGDAFGRRAFEDPVLVAVLAFYVNMRACEREAAQIVVEGGVFPTGGVVASFAGCAVLAVVFIIGFVAGVAILRRAFVLAVLVTILARYRGVFAFQSECGQVVVELGRFPAFRRMAYATTHSKTSFVGVVFQVAGFAGGGKSLEIGKSVSVLVAGGTGSVLMFALQGKTSLEMVKMAETVDPIVAGQTFRTKGGLVFFHVGGVERAVTFGAGLRVKAGNALGVAIVTGKGNARGTGTVRGKGKASDFMGKGGGIHNGQRG